MSGTATVVLTEDGCLPIPPEMLRDLKLVPSQPVQVRAEGGHLIVEQPSQEQIVAELQRLLEDLYTEEPLAEAWAEIEVAREDRIF